MMPGQSRIDVRGAVHLDHLVRIDPRLLKKAVHILGHDAGRLPLVGEPFDRPVDVVGPGLRNDAMKLTIHGPVTFLDVGPLHKVQIGEVLRAERPPVVVVAAEIGNAGGIPVLA
jgi:hypothetical protein